MICIYCLHKKTSTPNSRPHKKSSQVWRRRHCQQCNRTFTTYERPSLEDITIISADNIKTQFSLGRLTISLHNSLLSQKDPATTSYDLAQTIELHLLQRYDITTPITSSAIADEAYRTLRRYDELCGMQYGATHGLIASIRRRGRPSTTATSAGDVPGRD